MAKYFIGLLHDGSKITDAEGTDLPDDAAAEEHALKVAQELLSHNEARKRHWLLEVSNDTGEQLFKIPFDAIDSTIAHLRPSCRRTIEITCEKRRALQVAMTESRATVRRVRATVARSRGKPYLATEDGERL